jgi:hypothetical protein
VTSIPSAPVRHTALRVESLLRLVVPALLYATIGVELMVLVAWLPDTLGVWFRPDKNGYGDFPVFYRNASGFYLNGFYSPGLAVLMHPLTYLGMRAAFGVYFGINVAALAGVAYLAQRPVAALPGKAAMALGVFALPQTHWALRVGHFTEILAFAALAGLLLSDRKPVIAGVLIAVLALKPQYLPVPLLYLLWSRNWRALLVSVGGLAVLGMAGIAVFAVHTSGVSGAAGSVSDFYGSGVRHSAQYLTLGQRDQSYQQGWQYSWYGFLLSAGVQPNPLIAADLFVLSAAAMLVAWWKCTPSVAKVATALGMLLLTPHSSFYNWSMLAVAGALLLRADLRPRYLVPLLIGGMAAAAAATQKATPFPLPADVYRPAATLGVYWVQPAALASVFVLAVFGRRTLVVAEGESRAAEPSEMPARVAHTDERGRAGARAPRMALGGALAAIAVCFGYVSSAYVSGNGPFRSDPYFGRSQVLRALPSDFPVPPRASIDGAGPGSHLPYRVEWETPERTSDVAGLMRSQLNDGTWRVVDSSDEDGKLKLRSTRAGTGGLPPVIAEIAISAAGAGSNVLLEFSPLPASSVPGYEEWLKSIGIVVHNVDPDSPAARVTPAP